MSATIPSSPLAESDARLLVDDADLISTMPSPGAFARLSRSNPRTTTRLERLRTF